TPANVGRDGRQCERLSGRPAPRVRLVDMQRPEPGRMRPMGNTLPMFRARIAPAPRNVAPPVSARTDIRDLRTFRGGNAEMRGNGNMRGNGVMRGNMRGNENIRGNAGL